MTWHWQQLDAPTANKQPMDVIFPDHTDPSHYLTLF